MTSCLIPTKPANWKIRTLITMLRSWKAICKNDLEALIREHVISSACVFIQSKVMRPVTTADIEVLPLFVYANCMAFGPVFLRNALSHAAILTAFASTGTDTRHEMDWIIEQLTKITRESQGSQRSSAERFPNRGHDVVLTKRIRSGLLNQPIANLLFINLRQRGVKFLRERAWELIKEVSSSTLSQACCGSWTSTGGWVPKIVSALCKTARDGFSFTPALVVIRGLEQDVKRVVAFIPVQHLDVPYRGYRPP